MAWVFNGISLLSSQYNPSAMVQLVQSLSRELERLQKEIDELKKVK
jgi:hypothetical protein